MNTILYIDCDGVIFNTIETAFNMMRKKNLNLNDKKVIDYFFRTTSWEELMNNSIIINDAIEKINKIHKQELYQDVIILTKLSGNYDEERIKRDTFKILLPEIKVITLPFAYSKHSIVTPTNNILVDDEKRNINLWNENGGIGILFTRDINEINNDIINDLDDIENTRNVKLLRKTRNF